MTISTPEAAAQLRALTWYHDGAKIDPENSERHAFSADFTELTIDSAREEDVGTYEVRFEGLAAYPFSEQCMSEAVAILRQYPLLKPVTLELYIGKLTKLYTGISKQPNKQTNKTDKQTNRQTGKQTNK